MSICTSIELVESSPTIGDLVKVTIDDRTEALWFYPYADAVSFLNQEVIVDYRTDIYKGEMRQFIATFVTPTYVNTLDRKEGIKLYCDSEDNNSNLSFSEIEIGETRQGCIVYCISSTYKSSSAAVWMELKIRDKSMHVATLRLFNYSNKAVKMAGSYVMTELRRSEYGFQSELISPVNRECKPNPEIDIAKEFISNYFVKDAAAMTYIERYAIIKKLEEVVDYEPGYGLVRLAMELAMLESMYNITKDVDLDSIGEALLASRGYHARSSELSSTVNNVILASGINWNNKVTVVKLLDIPTEGEHFPERSVMEHIKDTIDNILVVRKGVTV